MAGSSRSSEGAGTLMLILAIASALFTSVGSALFLIRAIRDFMRH